MKNWDNLTEEEMQIMVMKEEEERATDCPNFRSPNMHTCDSCNLLYVCSQLDRTPY